MSHSLASPLLPTSNDDEPRHLVHSSSKQSIAISDDFYSLPDHITAESPSLDAQRPAYPELEHLQDGYIYPPQSTDHLSPSLQNQSSSQPNIFSTPPERAPSRGHHDVPHSSNPQSNPESIVTTPRPPHALTPRRPPSPDTVPHTPPHDIVSPNPILASPTYERQLRRKPLSSASTESTAASPSYATTTFIGDSKRGTMNDMIARTTTPGEDDMPYIRFAIEQLTRDEEVLHHGPFPQPTDNRDDLSQPESLRRSAQLLPHSRRSLQRPRHAPALGTTTMNRSSGSSGESLPSMPQPTYSQLNAPAFDSRAPQPLSAAAAARHSHMAQQKEVMASSLPAHPLHQSPVAAGRALRPLTGPSEESLLADHDDNFVPHNPSPDSTHPRLTFLPAILRPIWLACYTTLCACMTAGLIVCATVSKKNDGLWAYKKFGDSRYFVFQYLPVILGMILLLWLIQIQAAVQRITPFMAMASDLAVSRSHAAFLDLYPSQYLYPKLQYLRAKQYLVAACFFVFWLFLLTIPLLSSSFNARWVGDFPAGEWRWVATQGAIWTTIALYILLLVALVALMLHFAKSTTGLKWDPRSMADIIALLERANIMSDYAESENFGNKTQFRQRLWTRADRLGYWHTTTRPDDIFYGLGEPGGLTRRYSLEQGKIREKSHRAPLRDSSSSNLGEGFPDVEAQRRDRSTSPARGNTPWILTSSALLAFMLIALVLLIAFLVVSFVRGASTAGFFPKLRAESDAEGFSPANFLYSFLPGLLGILLFLLWQPLDYTIRRLAPYSNLSKKNGATAMHSILLDYSFLFPGQATLKALRNGDVLVAFTSAISLLAIPIPMLSGGVFWAQWYPSTSMVKVSAEPAGWYALCVFLAVYAFGFVVLFGFGIARRRDGLVPALPHSANCLAEFLSWVYMSPLVTDAAFTRATSKNELVGRLTTMDASEMVEEKGPADAVMSRFSPSPPRATVRLVGEAASSSSPQRGTDQAMRSPRAGGRENTTRPLTPLEHPSGPPRFAFGIYIGRDGREHLGIDRLMREAREMAVARDTDSHTWL